MIKKIIISICALFSFFLMFVFGFDSINILAISSFDNNMGTLPIQIDIENYNTNNYLNINNYNYSLYGVNYVFNDNYFTITGSRNSTANSYAYVDIENYTLNGNYTIYRSATWQGNLAIRDSNNNDLCSLSWGQRKKTCNINATIDKLYLDVTGIAQNTNININGFLMLYSGNLEPTSYYSPFKFGYILSGDIQLLCPNESVTQNISLLIFNNDDLLYKSNYFNGSSCGYIRFDNVYLPFNINNKGNVSFNLNLRFMIDGWGAGLYTLDYGTKLVLTPIYEAYYKGEFANDNIYTKLSYTSNNIYYNGYNLEYSDGSTNLFYFLGNKNILGYNLSIEESKFNKNVTSDYSIEINNYNKFSFNNFLNFPLEIYLFSGNENTTLMSMTSTNIYISFSSISSRVNNNQSTTTPLPDNELTIDKYNTCSAWYDIPCQLGNAVTYVIYETPIISPVLTFIVSFITMFSSLVSFVDLFRSFGIVFGCFIIYMFIELLHKYSK